MNSLNNGFCDQARITSTPGPAIRPGFHRWLTVTLDTVLTWFERARSRRELAKLDDRLLHDIGVARTDADNESRKPFWKD